MLGTPHGPDSFLLTFVFAHAHQMRCFSTQGIMPATMHVSTKQGVGNIFAGPFVISIMRASGPLHGSWIMECVHARQTQVYHGFSKNG